MKYKPDIHHRRSIRLKEYDYSQLGLYFITICTQNRLQLFGEISVGADPCACPKMILNDAGKMIETVWNEIPQYYEGFNIHDFMIMPNHIHGIIEIVGAGPTSARICIPPACPDDPTGQPQGVAPTSDRQSTIGDQPTIGQPTMSLSDIVHRFKTLTTKRYTDGGKHHGWIPFPGKLWQRNYYEHIIRDEKSYYQLSEYIQTNPLKWQDDKYYGP